MAAKLKILCLHGFTSSAARLSRQLGPVVTASAPWAEFTFVDAPFEVAPGYAWWRANERVVEMLNGRGGGDGAGGAGKTNVNGTDSASVNSASASTSGANANAASGVNAANGANANDASASGADGKGAEDQVPISELVTVYEGWETSRQYLHDILWTKGPFDGVLGFSQGAVVTSLLALMPEFSKTYGFGVEGAGAAAGGAHGGEKGEGLGEGGFAVIIGGFKARDPTLRKWFEETNEGFKRRSLHVWGIEDDIVPARASERLCEMFERPDRIVHAGGHVIPHDDLDAWVAFFRDRAEEKAARLSAAGAATEGEKAKF